MLIKHIVEYLAYVGKLCFEDPWLVIMVAVGALLVAVVCQGLIVKSLEEDIQELQERMLEMCLEMTDEEGDET